MNPVLLVALAIAVAITSVAATAAEPPKPTCRTGEKFDDKSKRCIPSP